MYPFRLWPYRRSTFCLAMLVAVAAVWPAHASEPFPFGSELMLDTAPMHGSKRIPMLEIEDNGTASIDLWCASVKAQATVNDAAITIVPGDAPAGAMRSGPASARCRSSRHAHPGDRLAAQRRSHRTHRPDAAALSPDDELGR